MAQKTALSIIATPGRTQSFSAKTAAGHNPLNPFTQLSLTATPGRRYSFTAKTGASTEDQYRGLLKLGLWVR